MKKAYYRKPIKTGGELIREVVRFFKSYELVAINSHILIAVSGGSDSTALAHLLVNFGRRIVPIKKIRLLHINHGWRGEFSDRDADFVQSLGKNWGVPVDLFSSQSITPPPGKSWEDFARTIRKKIYLEQTKLISSRSNLPVYVLTAHHADDLAETMIWRILTGSFWTHGAGILPTHGVEVRPFLQIRKSKLVQYLREEGVPWCEDATNYEGRFLRSKMRQKLMPQLEGIFPNGVEHLVQLATQMSDKLNKDDHGKIC